MSELAGNKKAVWDKLRGFQDPIVKVYAARNPAKRAKYQAIQDALYHETVSIKPVRAKREGPGGTKADWVAGVRVLEQYMQRRPQALKKALNEIENELKDLGRAIIWGQMTWIFRPVYTRYREDITLGADMLVEGYTNDGHTVNYWYDNTKNAESGHRRVIVNGKKVQLGEIHKVIEA